LAGIGGVGEIEQGLHGRRGFVFGVFRWCFCGFCVGIEHEREASAGRFVEGCQLRFVWLVD